MNSDLHTLGEWGEVRQQAIGSTSSAERGLQASLLSGPWARARLGAECHPCSLCRAGLNTQEHSGRHQPSDTVALLPSDV